MLVFDIETGPLPLDQLRAIMAPPEITPFDPSRIAPFDPNSVKYGNLKDPQKRAEKLRECEDAHAAMVAAAPVEHERTQREAREKYEADFISHAALDATSGRVLAIIYVVGDADPTIDADEDEAAMIGRFWNAFLWSVENKSRMAGHNVKGFDLPFLIRRSWVLGVPVPESVIRENRFWNPIFADTMEIFGCGQYGFRISLDNLCRALGLDGKNGSGAMFGELWEHDREAAVNYAVNEGHIHRNVAVRLGVV